MISYELYKKNNCILQIGGSDQWGNIVNGVDLIRRKLQKEAFGLTSPLITLASGAKMGKTEKGAIWLNEEELTPIWLLAILEKYWWQRCKKFLNFFTEIEVDECKGNFK